MRRITLLLIALLPSSVKKQIYRSLFGWKIGRNVKIGLSYIDARKVAIGDNVFIGHFNIIRGLRHFEIGADSCILNFNCIFGPADRAGSPDWSGSCILDDCVKIMSHHFFDVGGTITVGKRVTFAGRDSHVWSHSYQFYTEGRDHIRLKVVIGDDVYIGARSTIVTEHIPSLCVIGAGSVVTKKFPGEASKILIAGNPATIRKRYSAKPDAAPVGSHSASSCRLDGQGLQVQETESKSREAERRAP